MRRNSTTLLCRHCSNQFTVPVSIARAGRAYCSKACQMAALHAASATRFWAKTQRNNNGCMLWTGTVSNHGYGQICLWKNGKSLTQRAHRVAWEMTNGPVPYGLSVLHRCDVRLCCNPEHLFLGTQADNMADMVAKGRSATGERNAARKYLGSRRGERNNFVRLTSEQVHAIRKRYAAGGVTHKQIAAEYGVSRPTVTAIMAGRNWGWLDH